MSRRENLVFARGVCSADRPRGGAYWNVARGKTSSSAESPGKSFVEVFYLEESTNSLSLESALQLQGECFDRKGNRISRQDKKGFYLPFSVLTSGSANSQQIVRKLKFHFFLLARRYLPS